MGRIPTLEDVRAKYAVQRVAYVDQLAASLAAAPVVHLLSGLNSDSGAVARPASFVGLEALATETALLHAALVACRAIKSAEEQRLLRYVARVSSDAHCYVMRMAKAGMHEYQLEASFLHHCYMHGGCRFVSYTCICATGANAATLHYGHAGAPNDSLLSDGSLAMLDMGAEYACYGADISRTFPVGGRFSADQRIVYGAVLAAQDAVFAALRPGLEWADAHRLAERTILRHLTLAGLLRGSEAQQEAAQLGAVFMPHGLGHLLGIDTHDVGGFPPGRQRLAGPGISKLRMNRPLQAGMVLTVEPGCYFIDCLLDAAADDARQAPLLVPEVLMRFRGTGGVRLEDDVLITDAGFDNFTRCPRSCEEVEAVMAGAPWPPPTPAQE
jgi:Xaa-Pro dipeptidase